MNYQQITKALGRLKLSWRAAGEAAGKSPTTLIRVAKRDLTSRPTARALAAVLGLPVEEVFPDKPEYSKPDAAEQRAEAVAHAKANVEAMVA